MPRPRGPHSDDVSTVIAVRLSHDLAADVFRVAGAQGGPALAEWLRDVLRRAVGRPLDFEAGYEEGKAAGWAESNARFREALKGV